MPLKLDIFNKNLVVNQADYRTVYVLLSGENEYPSTDLSVLSSYATKSSLNHYLPLSGGTMTGNLILSGSDGLDKSLILYSPTVAASAEIKAAITFIGFNPGTGQFEPEPGVSFPRILIQEGRLDLNPDTIYTRAEFRVSNSNAQFNIYNKDLAKYYLRVRPNGGFEAGGTNLNATGPSSHCEGISTTASASASHAEGSGTQATGLYSHAEGLNTSANATATHAEGGGTSATSQYAHAEGFGTQASGDSSHAEGAATRASGFASHAGGTNTTAGGAYSFAHGGYSEAAGAYSYAMGWRSRTGFNLSYIWSDGNLGTVNDNTIQTTRAGQYMVSASGGMFIPGKVGIGTDSIANALTVVGDISATNTVYASVVALSSVTFTSETSIQPMSATDVYIKVIVENQERYLPLFALSAI
jgi:hypothetical protein